MNFTAMIAEIEAQIDVLTELRAVMTRAAGTGLVAKRRGRPPAWMKQTAQGTPLAPMRHIGTSDTKAGKHRKPFTAATRRKMALSQKKRWASMRKLAKTAKA